MFDEKLKKSVELKKEQNGLLIKKIHDVKKRMGYAVDKIEVLKNLI
jgi:hypothetical protein